MTPIYNSRVQKEYFQWLDRLEDPIVIRELGLDQNYIVLRVPAEPLLPAENPTEKETITTPSQCYCIIS
jgi:hypothetical protein